MDSNSENENGLKSKICENLNKNVLFSETQSQKTKWKKWVKRTA
jgi:hypothetical protein